MNHTVSSVDPSYSQPLPDSTAQSPANPTVPAPPPRPSPGLISDAHKIADDLPGFVVWTVNKYFPPSVARQILPRDPNDMSGPAGYGAQGFIQPGGALPYAVLFENEPTASAPAQVVTVTEQLDPNLDWNTFQLSQVGFGSTLIQVPPGLTTYSTRIDDTATLGVLVDVTAGINLTTGLVTWTFTSLDPATLDVPANPLAGFLPPDNAAGVGEGFVSYTIQPKSSAETTGTQIDAQATVVFDTNAPMNTADIVNTFETTPPTSSVTSLPAATSSTSFSVSWSGSDGKGSGIASYNVYVSGDGGPFQAFLTGTTQTSAIFTGQVGHTYGFYSIATSNIGLVQPTPSGAQATISIAPVPPSPLVTMTQVKEVVNKKHQVTELVITFSGELNSAEAAGLRVYRLATAGKHGSFTAKNAGVIKLKTAVYSATNDTVTLTPKKAFTLAKPVQLVVNGTPPSGLQDTLGRLFDGGSNAVAILSKGGKVQIDPMLASRFLLPML